MKTDTLKKKAVTALSKNIKFHVDRIANSRDALRIIIEDADAILNNADDALDEFENARLSMEDGIAKLSELL